MAHYPKLTDKKIEEFLEELRKDGNVTRACTFIGISRTVIYYRKKKDPEFAEAWSEAVQRGIDGLIDEAKRRAYSGITDPVYHKGERVGYKQVYSDTLLMFLIKGNRPEYRDKFIELPDQGHLEMHFDFGTKDDDGRTTDTNPDDTEAEEQESKEDLQSSQDAESFPSIKGIP